LSWVFLLDPNTGATQSSAAGCGQHGVDSILANGTSDNGNALQVIALCVPGSFTGTAPPGNWTFTFQMLDAGELPVRPVSPPPQSKYAPAPLPTVTAPAASIVAGGPTAEFPVRLDVTGLSTCNDGIDNDGDGLVDQGRECDAGPDSGTSRDSGTVQDSGAVQDSGISRDAAHPEGGPQGSGDGGPQDAAGDARG